MRAIQRIIFTLRGMVLMTVMDHLCCLSECRQVDKMQIFAELLRRRIQSISGIFSFVPCIPAFKALRFMHTQYRAALGTGPFSLFASIQ